jgi:hypothetical protein
VGKGYLRRVPGHQFGCSDVVCNEGRDDTESASCLCDGQLVRENVANHEEEESEVQEKEEEYQA